MRLCGLYIMYSTEDQQHDDLQQRGDRHVFKVLTIIVSSILKDGWFELHENSREHFSFIMN